ncbi:GNAT family N-acetyltransferase [Psychrobacter sp. FDAARGOS_221]|uniref:GNAT family N-acetyltransferase n=1 Tax=Psychrobacter sp. FDAARGOS_221 TaxID=1975705 RepID=UPI000BB588AD|nr:GNAT family N-acetyltransferase [Psychrobacter sp. FDAARGOS_221]PNK60269.1 N-acetyltransferase [Psychrobacter sp. FDAARGOS_221]
MNTSTDAISIRPLSRMDYPQWLNLWQGYLRFYNTQLSQDINQATWDKLLDDGVAVYGFGAYQGHKLLGFAHVVLHPNTWDTTDCCYLEDLYVDATLRGRGVGRALIEHIYQFAADKHCNRVYWTTQVGNTTARRLYDSLASETDMVQYRHNLSAD